MLFDVRAPALIAEGHVPGALDLPRGKMTEQRPSEWPAGALFVIWCAGLGRSVKVVVGGVTGWADEGLAAAKGA